MVSSSGSGASSGSGSPPLTNSGSGASSESLPLSLSGSPPLTNSGSDEDLQAVMDQRKRKRMLSNRESARRSRMRKRKHLDELMGQVAQLRKENGEILAALNVTTQHYAGVKGENSVLETQMMELSNRLQSLNEILHFIGGDVGGDGLLFDTAIQAQAQWNPNSQMFMMNQTLPMMPVMGSAQMFQYC